MKECGDVKMWRCGNEIQGMGFAGRMRNGKLFDGSQNQGSEDAFPDEDQENNAGDNAVPAKQTESMALEKANKELDGGYGYYKSHQIANGQ